MPVASLQKPVLPTVDAAHMKIDLHTHILPHDWPDLDKKYGYPGFVRLDHYKPCCARMMMGDRVFREITDNVWDPKRRIEECDRDGVSMQVLSTVPVMFSYWAKPADALDLSRRLNDHIAEVVRHHPKRFAGLGTIPMQDPDLAAGELERCGREFACDLLNDLWWRVRTLSEAPRRLCARRRRVSIYDRSDRARVSRAAGFVRDGQQCEPSKLSRSRKQKG